MGRKSDVAGPAFYFHRPYKTIHSTHSFSYAANTPLSSTNAFIHKKHKITNLHIPSGSKPFLSL